MVRPQQRSCEFPRVPGEPSHLKDQLNWPAMSRVKLSLNLIYPHNVLGNMTIISLAKRRGFPNETDRHDFRCQTPDLLML